MVFKSIMTHLGPFQVVRKKSITLTFIHSRYGVGGLHYTSEDTDNTFASPGRISTAASTMLPLHTIQVKTSLKCKKPPSTGEMKRTCPQVSAPGT